MNDYEFLVVFDVNGSCRDIRLDDGYVVKVDIGMEFVDDYVWWNLIKNIIELWG